MDERSDVPVREPVDQTGLQSENTAIAGALVLGTGIGKQIVLATFHLHADVMAKVVGNALR
jgi:hypothetical protein